MLLTVAGSLPAPAGASTIDLINTAISILSIGAAAFLILRIQAMDVAAHDTRAQLAHVTRLTTLGELTASIAHEVNQPLGALVAEAEACLLWLGQETADVDEARQNVERIIMNGHRAGEVIRRVRALSKKADPQKAPIDINDIVNEVITLVRREAVSQRVALRMELAPTIPLVMADRVQLQQVLINLVINGIEAMQAVTDRTRELVIRSHRDDADQVLITVKDCGVGFSADNAGRLFNAFFTTKSGGMGLGLAISRSIIEAHGGRLSASGNVGPGATFQFALPAHGTAAL
jgi:C4-dicarboxylate-specific signal transduction histidine kinase